MIIADTGFFVALANPGDDFHRASIKALSQVGEPLVTTLPVLSETSYLLIARGGYLSQVAFLRSIAEGLAEVFSLETSYLLRMAMLMERYGNLPMDMADASLVVLAESLGHGRILTVDRRDFNIYRWSDRNPFINLLLEY